MKISRSAAASIVREISGVLLQQVNLMDADSLIIASTDPMRIGTAHEGARYLIKNGLSELIIHEDNQFAGTRKGINLPIEIDGETVGVVGLTGEYDAVVGYGKVIKKMTEILLLEEQRNEGKALKRSSIAMFLQKWILSSEYPNSQNFNNYGLTLGIDVRVPWRVVLLQPSFDIFDASAARQELVRRLENRLRRLAGELCGFFALAGSCYLLLLPQQDTEALRGILGGLQRTFQVEYAAELFIGADSAPASEESMYPSYLRAEKALQASMMNEGQSVCFYDDITLEIFVRDVSPANREAFIEKTFHNCSVREIAEYRTVLQALFDCDGSISRASARLFIHKNTLQYKLNKLTDQTGNNPRTYKGAALFQIAMAFLKARPESGERRGK